MRSHRVSWLGSSIIAAALFLAPAASTARAQPGFGPDPFWPYNNQYTPYVSPMGPASPAGGQGDPSFTREGIRGSNRFQDYLEDLQGGPGRNVSDRSSVGMPYFRSAVDPSFELRNRGPRQYQPNLRTTETFENSQRRVADLYYQYYAERDPAKRSEFLKKYRAARRDAAYAVSDRGRSPSAMLDSADPLETRPRRGARAGSAPSRNETRTGAGALDRERTQSNRFGPAPDVPGFSTRGSAGSSRRSRPSDVLNRSRAMDRLYRTPGAGRSPRPSPSSGPAIDRRSPSSPSSGRDTGEDSP